MIKAKPEKFALEGITINDLIKESFLKKLKDKDNNIFPVSLVFINEKGNEKNRQFSPLIISHQSNEEVKNKILHVESPDTELAKFVTKILEVNLNGE